MFGRWLVMFFNGSLVILLLAWYAFWLSVPINLATADLGRHLTNGRVLVNSWPEQGRAVLTTNFYSYTNPDFPFLNHHWGAGVIFFLIKQWFGFGGLHIFYIGISLVTFLIFLAMAKGQMGLRGAVIAAIPLVPAIAYRREVRPEVFSYLLAALYCWLLYRKRQGLGKNWIWLIPLGQIIWVNLHSYFFIGLGIIGAFTVETWLDAWRETRSWQSAGRSSRPYAVLFLLAVTASLIHPSGVRALLAPLTMFSNYGYEIVENKSIIFLQRWGNMDLNFLFVQALSLLLAALWLWGGWRRKKWPLAMIILTAALGIMAWLAVRNITLFALFSLPALAAGLAFLPWDRFSYDRTTKFMGSLTTIIIVAAGTYFYYFSDIYNNWNNLGLGLAPGVDQAADFIRSQNIKGPVFNNYDIGSYLVYHLYPNERVFVDNRPEAYPANFFRETYIPMQESAAAWQAQLEKYRFNTIVFWRHDLTPWAQPFLKKIVRDNYWVPVFVDDYNIIFIRNAEANQKIIDRFAIPRGVFSRNSFYLFTFVPC